MLARTDLETIASVARALRVLSVDATEHARSGHPGMPMGFADVASVLFLNYLRYDPACPLWPDRDRFVLSAGHGSILLYGLSHLLGLMPMDEIRRFRQLGSRTPGHPELDRRLGIETTTGPLGQGLANAVGMALGERMLAARHGEHVVNHHTWVVVGDGCLMEGISHEAISLAGHWQLGKLVVLFDDNGISIDGAVSLACSDDQHRRFEACGWHAQSCDGHDLESVEAAIDAALADPRPSFIACRTVIGYGSPNKAGSESTHGTPLGEEESAATRTHLKWNQPAFEIPTKIYKAFEGLRRRGAEARKAWQQICAPLPETRLPGGRTLEDALAPIPASASWNRAVRAGTAAAMEALNATEPKAPSVATRQSSAQALNHYASALPQLVGGSADLTGSTGAHVGALGGAVSACDFSGRYVRFGVREHAMAGVMNGLALHGGLAPYGSTFLTFSDYLRPSLRLAALMGLGVIYVFTHDSVALGEDGPTHQPIEHLDGLRAVPNLHVYRPADSAETIECWALALQRRQAPSALVLTRQRTPELGVTRVPKQNLSARGAYLVKAPKAAKPDLTLIGSGSEVALCVEAARLLARKKIKACVLSCPAPQLLGRASRRFGGAPRLFVEAASGHYWQRFTRGGKDQVLGLTQFGHSAPQGDVLEHVGLTPSRIAQHAQELIHKR